MVRGAQRKWQPLLRFAEIAASHHTAEDSSDIFQHERAYAAWTIRYQTSWPSTPTAVQSLIAASSSLAPTQARVRRVLSLLDPAPLPAHAAEKHSSS